VNTRLTPKKRRRFILIALILGGALGFCLGEAAVRLIGKTDADGSFWFRGRVIGKTDAEVVSRQEVDFLFLSAVEGPGSMEPGPSRVQISTPLGSFSSIISGGDT
jgi:hypothetical protein